MNSSPPHLTQENYTVACICPMGVEQAPVEAMLDEIHPSLPTSLDKNSYTLGRMGIHNVVIATMPDIGNNSAASVANQLLNDFRSVRFSLLIGVGGGVPNLGNGIDIRLGDVVFDRGKTFANGRFEQTGALLRPPDILLATVARLEALHRRVDSDIPNHLQEMIQKYPKMRRGKYIYQGSENDRLFQKGSEHIGGQDCEGCNPTQIVMRESRSDFNPVIHYGTIGSSNSVIKDGQTRDMLRDDLKIQCLEMEAAGLMESFPCLVIRGICDYADSHKNKRWQPYAAAVAAAYAKELLSLVPVLNRASPVRTESDSFPVRGYQMIETGDIKNFVPPMPTGFASHLSPSQTGMAPLAAQPTGVPGQWGFVNTPATGLPNIDTLKQQLMPQPGRERGFSTTGLSGNANIPWAITKEENEIYDQLFRAWDGMNKGYVFGDLVTGDKFNGDRVMR